MPSTTRKSVGAKLSGDPPQVTARRAELGAQSLTGYWLVASAHELLVLVQEDHPFIELRRQAMGLLHRGGAESTEEFAARVEETGTVQGVRTKTGEKGPVG